MQEAEIIQFTTQKGYTLVWAVVSPGEGQPVAGEPIILAPNEEPKEAHERVALDRALFALALKESYRKSFPEGRGNFVPASNKEYEV